MLPSVEYGCTDMWKKWIIALLVLLILLPTLAAGALYWWLDAEQLKQQFSAQVQQQTGRTLQIKGAAELSLWPQLALRLHDVQLGNPAGFSRPEFAELEQLDVQVRWQPLLQRRVAVEKLVLRGARVYLERNAQGQANWQVTTAANPPPPTTPTAPPPAVDTPPASTTATPRSALELRVGSISLRQTQLQFNDLQQQQRWQVSALDLELGPLFTGQETLLETRFHWQLPGLASQWQLRTHMQIDGSHVQLPDLALQINLLRDGWPAQGVPLQLSANLGFDWQAHRLELATLQAQIRQLALSGTMRIQDWTRLAGVQGQLNLAPFNLRQLLQELQIQLPPLRDEQALQQFQLQTGFNGEGRSLRLEPLRLKLDQSQLNGSIAWSAERGLGFDLQIDQLDSERYRPQPVRQAGSGGAGAEAEAERLWPINGRLRIQQLKLGKAQLTQVLVPIQGTSAQLRLQPQAQLYQGQYQGDWLLSLQARPLQLQLNNEQLQNIAIGPLLTDLKQQPSRIEGTANIHAELTLPLAEPQQLRQVAQGTVRVEVRNGAFTGVDMRKLLRQARALLQREAPPDTTTEDDARTPFSQLNMTLKLGQGQLYNPDLQLLSPVMRASGQGWVKLQDQSLDYRLLASAEPMAQELNHPKLDMLRKLQLPIHITGTVGELKFKLDADELVKRNADLLLEQQRDQVQQHLEGQARQRLEQRLGPDGVEALRGLLGR